MNKPNYQKTKSGSALIITLLVITVVSAIVFSVGRLAIGDLKMSTQLENSEQAYYAAEGGIETGLLLFRYDTTRTLETTKGATAKDGNPLRVNLSTNKIIPPASYTPAAPPSSDIAFDLKEWYRNEAGVEIKVESTIDANGKTIPALAKDETVEYNIFNTNGDLRIAWEYKDLTPSITDQLQMRLEYMAFNEDKEVVARYLFMYNDRNKNNILRTLLDVPLNGSNAKILRLKSWGANIDHYTISGDLDDKLDNQLSTIESTGYYGGAKRKLEITLDRTTGTLLGLHDFVLFGSSNISSQ